MLAPQQELTKKVGQNIRLVPEAEAKKGSVYDQDVYERSGGNHGLLLSLHGAFLDLGKVQSFIKTFSYSDNHSTGGVATPVFFFVYFLLYVE